MDSTIVIICQSSQLVPIGRFLSIKKENNIEVYTLDDVKVLGLAKFIDDIVREIRAGKVSITIGTSDHASVLATYINEKSGLKYNSTSAIISAQNKYLSRQIQRQSIPESIPNFALAKDVLGKDSSLSFPLFAKPTVSCFSHGAQTVASKTELEELIHQKSNTIGVFNSVFNEILDYLEIHDIETYHEYMCEEIIPDGDQITVDGYICNGNIVVLGSTQSIFYEDIPSFKQFDYPYHCSQNIQDKITNISYRFIKSLNLNNMNFNIEMVIDPETKVVRVLELNTRLSLQFSYLFEQVLGLNTLEVAWLVATGIDPMLSLQRQAHYSCCSSLVLRRFEDQRVVKLPSLDDIEKIRQEEGEFQLYFPVKEGQLLSEIQQDEYSFRYGFLDIPGDSFSDILEKFHRIQEKLPIQFTVP